MRKLPGWMLFFAYACVHALPEMLGAAEIFPAERCTHPDERGVGEPCPAPAVPWFKPLPGGPLRTLLFIGEFQRDAAELAQRLDVDCDLVYCPTYRGSGKVDAIVAFDPERIMKRLAGRHYDLIILAGRPSTEGVVQGIIDAVRAGAGMLAIGPLQMGAAAEPGVLQPLLDELPQQALRANDLAQVLGSLDPSALAATSPGSPPLKSLAIREMGRGRVASINWTEKTPGLLPFSSGVCEYWEYQWAALGKACLWAARRESARRISSLTCDGRLSIQVESPARGPLDLHVQWDGRFQCLPVKPQSVRQTLDGKAAVVIEIPGELRRARGPHVVRVRLAENGRALDAGATVVTGATPGVEILRLEAPAEARAGEKVAVTVAARIQDGTRATLRAELVDAFDRVVSRDEIRISESGEREATLFLCVQSPLAVAHRVVASAVDEGVLVDRQERRLLVPDAAKTHLDDFRLGTGYAAMTVRCPGHLRAHLTRFLGEQGLRAVAGNEYMIERGMAAWGGVVGGEMSYQGKDHLRNPCFSDPAQVKALAGETVKNVGKKRAWGFAGYNLRDEVHLSQRGDVEVCTCPFCVKGFRAWAAETYGTMAMANAEWGTNYGRFDEVPVPLLAEMKGEANPARWVDFRLFQERVWAQAYAAVHEAVRAAHPNANLSFTNPYKFNSLAGVDFSLWAPHEEVMLRYSHRHVMDRNRSWSSAPVLSWFGYRSNATECGHFVWWFALNGGVMPIWWDPVEPWAYSGKDGFTAWYLWDPLWRTTGRSEAVTAAARVLQSGIGRLLRLAQPAPAEAAILHSQVSMHLLYAKAALKAGRPVEEGYSRFSESDQALAAALKRHAIGYRYLLPDRLTPETLAGIQLLVLPSCVALTSEAVAGIRAFAGQGGKLLADVMPGTSDGHGKPLGQSPLADLFAEGPGISLGRAATQESAAELDEAIQRLAVRPALHWATASGALPTHTEVYRFRLGNADYLGLIRKPTPEAADEGPLTVRLPTTANAFDCRAGKALGKVASLLVEIPPGDACFLALLPYAPHGVTAAAEIGTGALQVRAKLGTDAPAGDHVFRVEVVPPGASGPVPWYCLNLSAPKGEMTCAIPLALNDPKGSWTVRIRDIATGLGAETRVTWK